MHAIGTMIGEDSPPRRRQNQRKPCCLDRQSGTKSSKRPAHHEPYAETANTSGPNGTSSVPSAHRKGQGRCVGESATARTTAHVSRAARTTWISGVHGTDVWNAM